MSRSSRTRRRKPPRPTTRVGKGAPRQTNDAALQEAIRHHRAGRLDDAEQIYRRILQRNGHDPEALHLMGAVHIARGRFAQGEELLRIALARNPEHPAALCNLGVALKKQEKFEESITILRQAMKAKPDSIQAKENYADVLIAMEQVDEAVSFCQDCLRTMPRKVPLLNSLAVAFGRSGKIEEAEQLFGKILSQQPEYSPAHLNLGNLRRKMGKYDQAVEAYRKALSIDESSPEAWANLAVSLREIGRPNEALDACLRSIELRPHHAMVYGNLGNIHSDLGDRQAARDAYVQALGMTADHVDSRFGIGLLDLTEGNLAEGWEAYNLRWDVTDSDLAVRDFPQPMWDGSAESITKVLLWGEQGIGDEVMFATLIPDMLQRGVGCVVECTARLVPLLSRSFPDVTVLPRTMPPRPECFDESITHQLPLGSLPGLLRRDMRDFASQRPCLQADPQQTAACRERYCRGSDRLVGISWRSGNRKLGQKRSLPLHQWKPILRQPGLRFINLQYGDTSEERRDVTQQLGVDILHDDAIDPMEDLDAFAAQVAAMDLVISIDNSTVHFAGALGVDVWTLLPFVAEWRWMLERSDSPWYPTMRLFRQPAMDDWFSVVEAVRKTIEGTTDSARVSQNKQTTDDPKENARRARVLEEHKTDMERWKDQESLHELWGRRSELASRWVPPGARVLDLGCGAMSLEQHLPSGCEYIPVDLVARDERTIVCDFNHQPLPSCPRATHISVLGVLEYVFKPEEFLRCLRAMGLPVILSYCYREFTSRWDRPEMGVANAYDQEQLETLLQRSGFALRRRQRIDVQQTLLYLEPAPKELMKSSAPSLRLDRSHPGLGYHALAEQYALMHSSGYSEVLQDGRQTSVEAEAAFQGNELPRFLQPIKSMIDAHGARTILDYGSGKGTQYQPRTIRLPDGQTYPDARTYWGVETIRCYDPGVPEFSNLPTEPLDGVVCTDVLEHCPPEDIPWILEELFRLARRFVFATIACYPAKAHLPDGRNAHITLRSADWWKGCFAALGNHYPHVDYLFCAADLKPDASGVMQLDHQFFHRKQFP